jgi:MtrB/PioB family decaheme-associated outer membrane protein
MYEMQNTFRLSAMAIALLSAFGTVWADDDEVAELIKPESTISVGIGNWSNDRHQQGIYDGMRENGPYGLFDVDIVRRNDETGTWMKLKGTNLGLEDRELKGEYLRQGNFGVTVDYNKLTRDNPNTYTTRLKGIGTTTEIVTSTGPMQTVNLGTTREGVGVGIYKNLAPGLDFNLSFKNEEKNGTRAWGRGSAPEFAVEPINSTTRQLETTLSYSTKIWQLSGGYYGSWYENNNDMVSVFTNTLGNSPTYLSLPLDNQAHQLFLNGGVNFTPTTRGTLKMSYTRATQNEHLPTKDVAGLSFNGSPSSLNGEINTTLVQLGVTSRPIKDLSLLANLRYHNVDDATPIYRFVQLGSCSTAGNCVDNTPLSYKTLTGKFEATYRLIDGYSITGGVEQRWQDRKFPVSNTLGTGGSDTQRVVPMRTDVDETTWRLELRRNLSEVLNGSLAYVYATRTGSGYNFAAGPGNDSANGFTNISNQINPLNIADRDRNKIRGALDWSPMENLSFQFTVEQGRDKYDHDTSRSFGLEEGTSSLYAIDASYILSEKWKINAWYSYDHSQAKQKDPRASNGGGNAAIKDYELTDTGNSIGLGMRGEPTSRIKLGADVQWTRNVSQYQQTVTALNGTAGTNTVASFSSGLPNIENKLTRLSFFSIYSLAKHSDLRFDLINERWKTNDWSWMFANGSPFVYSAATDGTTVTSNPSQNSTFVGLRYIYKFQ